MNVGKALIEKIEVLKDIGQVQLEFKPSPNVYMLPILALYMPLFDDLVLTLTTTGCSDYRQQLRDREHIWPQQDTGTGR